MGVCRELYRMDLSIGLHLIYYLPIFLRGILARKASLVLTTLREMKRHINHGMELQKVELMVQ